MSVATLNALLEKATDPDKVSTARVGWWRYMGPCTQGDPSQGGTAGCFRAQTFIDRSARHENTQDARFMATNDLCAELQKDIKMDVNMVRKIRVLEEGDGWRPVW